MSKLHAHKSAAASGTQLCNLFLDHDSDGFNEPQPDNLNSGQRFHTIAPHHSLTSFSSFPVSFYLS